MRRCDNNEHFYDENKHSSCPYCTGARDNGAKTVVYGGNKSSSTVKIDTPANEELPKNTIAMEPTPTPKQEIPATGPKTVAAWGKKKTTTPEATQTITPEQNTHQETTNKSDAPVVGWFVIIEGDGEGTDFRIIPGMNTIGREHSNAISINFGDTSISREKHCTIIFDYKNKLFFLQHGDGSNLTYLNDSVILTPTQLKAGDILGLGDTKLKFIPFCCNDFCWEL